MQNFFSRHATIFSLLLLTLFGALFRFYNLNWGAPFYFHPDERNVASAISQLQFPSQMNPHFFAYGSLPLYFVYFSDLTFNFLTSCHFTLNSCSVLFEQALVSLRILAAFLNVVLIPIMYIIGKKLKNRQTGIILAFLATTSIGLIQYSHFGTYESVITFFSALFFLACLYLLEKVTKWNIFITALIGGILVSCKVTNVVLLFIPLGILFANLFKGWRHLRLKHRFLNLLYTFSALLTYLLIALYVFILTNPYTFWDFNSFLNSMHYESSVAFGTEPVFYTGEFFNTFPILYQIQHVFPFLITPFLLLFLVPALGYVFVRLIIKPHRSKLFLLIVFLLLTLIPQAILFVKWTRYMVPVTPFLYCCIALFITEGVKYLKKQFPHHYCRLLIRIGLILGGSISCIYALAFLITVYVEPDTRVAAAQFANKQIPANAPILSEVYDMGIVTFNPSFQNNIKLFNFYDLDNTSPETNQFTLRQSLQASDYIVLPSQRILKVSLQNAKKFPMENMFYKRLLSGKNGFRKIYETPCDIWCLITYSGNPVNSYEETASVFDRPTIYIFKKK